MTTGKAEGGLPETLVATRRPLVYDTGALIAAQKGSALFRALHRRAIWLGIVPVVPAAILAACYAGGGALDHLLSGCEVAPLSEPAGKRAGLLRTRCRRGSAVDAICVELALRRGAACVTSDPVDLLALAAVAGRTVDIIEI